MSRCQKMLCAALLAALLTVTLAEESVFDPSKPLTTRMFFRVTPDGEPIGNSLDVAIERATATLIKYVPPQYHDRIYAKREVIIPGRGHALTWIYLPTGELL